MNPYPYPPVVVLDLHRSVELRRGIAAQAAELGWRILDLQITRGNLWPEMHLAGLLTERFLDNPLVQRMRGEGRAVVRVGRLPHPDADSVLPAILSDRTAGGRLAAEHFAERRFRHLAYIGNRPWKEYPCAYYAFHERAVELDCTCHLLQVETPSDPASRKERFDCRMAQIADWLVTIPNPVGIFTYNDRFAAEIFTVARLKGLECPEDVALIGIGNDPEICEFLPVPLSSLDLNEAERGRRAVTLLNHLLRDETVPEMPLLIPPKGIVERQSTNLLAVGDPVVAKALRFIWDHYVEQLSVADIAAAAGVAPNTLFRKFRECLEHGVNAELRRKRLERCAELLRSTDRTVAEIAAASGFPTLSYLFKAFHDAFGLTPAEYRRQNSA